MLQSIRASNFGGVDNGQRLVYLLSEAPATRRALNVFAVLSADSRLVERGYRMSVTPRPWRRSSNANDAIIAEGNARAHTDTEAQYYGGPVIAESIQSDDLDFILEAVKFYDLHRSRR